MPKDTEEQLLEELEISETGESTEEDLSMEEELEQEELVSEETGITQSFGIASTIEPVQYLVAASVIKPLAEIINVCGGTSASPAATTLTSNPSIMNGTNGQNLTIRGTSDTGTITLTNGNGIKINGNITLGLNDTNSLYFDEKVGSWIEKSRNQTGPVGSPNKVTLATTTQSTTSSTFADITGATITVTTEAVSVLVGAIIPFDVSGAGKMANFQLVIDDAAQGGTKGIYQATPGNTATQTATIIYQTAVLTAGSHTFKLQFASDDNSTTLRALESSSNKLIFFIQ